MSQVDSVCRKGSDSWHDRRSRLLASVPFSKCTNWVDLSWLETQTNYCTRLLSFQKKYKFGSTLTFFLPFAVMYLDYFSEKNTTILTILLHFRIITYHKITVILGKQKTWKNPWFRVLFVCKSMILPILVIIAFPSILQKIDFKSECWYKVQPPHCVLNSILNLRSLPGSHFKSLIKSLIQYPTLEILHRGWLGIRTPSQILWNISMVGYCIRDLIRDLKWKPDTDLYTASKKSSHPY